MQQEILVVDGEASVVEVVSLHLKRDGFAVRVARDGREALAAVQEKAPDLISGFKEMKHTHFF